MVSQEKIKQVQELSEMLRRYNVIGLADIMDLPTKQLQIIRKKLKEKGIIIKVVKKSILKRALDAIKNEKSGIEKFEEFIEKGKRIGPALIFGKDVNPFKLYKMIEENKSPAPAKPGAIAPRDIVIPAGPTPFGPGPMIGELSRMGLKVKVEGGKIVIQEDKVIVRAGETINEKVAELLNKLGIEPLEIKLNVVAIWDKGIIYTSDVLAIDEEEYRRNVVESFMHALNLMLATGFPVKEYMDIMIQKAFENVLKLSLEVGMPSKDNIEILIRKSLSFAVLVSGYLPEDIRPSEIQVVEYKRVTEEPQEEKKEEKKAEEEQKKQEEALSGLGALFGL